MWLHGLRAGCGAAGRPPAPGRPARAALPRLTGACRVAQPGHEPSQGDRPAHRSRGTGAVARRGGGGKQQRRARLRAADPTHDPVLPQLSSARELAVHDDGRVLHGV